MNKSSHESRVKKSVIIEFIILAALIYLCFPRAIDRTKTTGIVRNIEDNLVEIIKIPEARAEEPAAKPKTVGVYSLFAPDEVLKSFPYITTYLFYMDIDDESSVDRGIEIYKNWKNQKNDKKQSLHPQVAIELRRIDLKTFTSRVKDRNSNVRKNIRKFADALKDDPGPIYLRPFSEMNDLDSSGASWKLGRGPHANTVKEFADAWMALVDAFREAGLKNAEFHFNVLAAKNVGNRSDEGNVELTFKALELIKPGYVDALGFNVYARPRGAVYARPGDKSQNGNFTTGYVPFSELVQPWLNRLRKSSRPTLPNVVGEMGASNQSTDREKAKWIQKSFEFCRSNKFYMVTYFNWHDTNWAALKGTDSDKFLKAELLKGL